MRILFIVLLFMLNPAFGQENISISEQTIKIAPLSEETYYFAVAEGDKLIINIRENQGKRLHAIEVAEYPLNIKYLSTKISEVKNLEINIPSEAIYVLKLRNNSISSRECQINIDRIPATKHSRNFNTSVRWVTVNDTTWKSSFSEGIIRYDTLYTRNKTRGVVFEDFVEELVLNKVQRVHAKTALKTSKTQIPFNIPPNIENDEEEKALISWAYWIGVDEAGNQAWEHNSQIISKIVKGGASIFLSPLAALALGAVTDLTIPTMGEDVNYTLTREEVRFSTFKKTNLNAIDKGKGIAAYQRFEPGADRKFNLILQNDNIVQGIDVNVKVVAVYQYKRFGPITETEIQVKPIKGKVQERIPVVKTVRIPVRME